MGLSSDDETVDADDTVQQPLRESGRMLTEAERNLSLTTYFESATKERLVRVLVDICRENRMVEEWVRRELDQQVARVRPNTTVEVPAPAERPQSRAKAAVKVAPSRPLGLPEVITTCQNCGARFDANKEIQPNECYHHIGMFLNLPLAQSSRLT